MLFTDLHGHIVHPLASFMQYDQRCDLLSNWQQTAYFWSYSEDCWCGNPQVTKIIIDSKMRKAHSCRKKLYYEMPWLIILAQYCEHYVSTQMQFLISTLAKEVLFQCADVCWVEMSEPMSILARLKRYRILIQGSWIMGSYLIISYGYVLSQQEFRYRISVLLYG